MTFAQPHAGPAATRRSTLVDAGAVEIARRVRAGEVSAVEVFDAFHARIAALNPALNALVRFDPDVGRREALAADRRLRDGDRSPLLGVPFTAKDNLWVAGEKSSQGSARFADFRAPRDADAVARLRMAGAVFVGITNCSEFACKGVTTNRLFGPTRNPWDLALTPGGSSGGAASAVAAGLSPIGLTTDGGGSTRRPAAHAGVVGMKPSAGLVPHTHGFAEPVFGNAVVGQMARRVADVAAVLDAIAVPDAADWQAPPRAVWRPGQADPARLGPVTIAFSPDLGLGLPVEPDVAATVALAVQRLRQAGLDVVDAAPRWPAGAGEQALMPLQLAGLASLYGDAYRRREWDADPDIGAQIEAGLRLSGREVTDALLAREAMHQALHRFFLRHDFLLTPTTPVTAWPFTQPGPARIDGQSVSPRAHAAFTPIFNHAFVPACSVPCGLDGRGLPVGLQVVGPRWSDARVLALATLVERQCPIDFSLPRDPPSHAGADAAAPA